MTKDRTPRVPSLPTIAHLPEDRHLECHEKKGRVDAVPGDEQALFRYALGLGEDGSYCCGGGCHGRRKTRFLVQ